MNSKQRYQVTVKVELLYEVEVEANDFQGAVAIGRDEATRLQPFIIESVSSIAPDEALLDASVDIVGVYKL